MSDSSYDAIIIGAGIGGLVCGCYLAKAGMNVLICEQHSKPGGYCTSFRRGPFIFDAAAHSFGSFREKGTLRFIFEDLNISKDLKIVRFNPSDIIVTKDFMVKFHNNIEETIDNFATVFPAEKDNIRLFFDFIKNSNHKETIKIRNKTFEQLLRSFFKNEILINTISVPILGNGGLPQSQIHAFTGTRIMMEFLIDGGYYPVGGMQIIPDMLAKFFLKQGGKILYNTHVAKIIYQNKKVSGLKLSNNETVHANYIIAACDVTSVFKEMISLNNNTSIIAKLNKMLPSISTFVLYLGLKEDFDSYAAGSNIWYMDRYSTDQIYQAMKECDIKKIKSFMFRISHDKKTLLAFSLASFKSKKFWYENKEKYKELLIQCLESVVPGIQKSIIFFESATPYTLWKYTFNRDGANYGWAPTPAQLFDPDFKCKTFIRGLYLTGHWTAQTHGIPGVAYLGYNTANYILKNYSKEKYL